MAVSRVLFIIHAVLFWFCACLPAQYTTADLGGTAANSTGAAVSWGRSARFSNCSALLAHDRRRILHFGVTAHPIGPWTAQQLRNAFPWDTTSRYLLRDRDRIFGEDVTRQVQDMGIQEVLSAPRSPWQRAYVERVIGTIRSEGLDHVIVFNEASLYRHVKTFVAYYHESRTYLSLSKDSPEPRAVQPPALGRIVAIPQVGGPHHRYERRGLKPLDPPWLTDTGESH